MVWLVRGFISLFTGTLLVRIFPDLPDPVSADARVSATPGIYCLNRGCAHDRVVAKQRRLYHAAILWRDSRDSEVSGSPAARWG